MLLLGFAYRGRLQRSFAVSDLLFQIVQLPWCRRISRPRDSSNVNNAKTCSDRTPGSRCC